MKSTRLTLVWKDGFRIRIRSFCVQHLDEQAKTGTELSTNNMFPSPSSDYRFQERDPSTTSTSPIQKKKDSQHPKPLSESQLPPLPPQRTRIKPPSPPILPGEDAMDHTRHKEGH